jgi:hypothetical protein
MNLSFSLFTPAIPPKQQNAAFDPLAQPKNLTKLMTGNRIVEVLFPEGPSPLLSERQRVAASRVLAGALRSLSKTFPKADIRVIYLPSPLVAYRPAKQTLPVGPHRHDSLGERATTTEVVEMEATRIWEISNQMCSAVRAVAEKLGFGFLDTRASIQKATLREPLHGSKDWGHFNRAGYTLLGDLIAQYLPSARRDSGCSTLTP